MLTEKLVEIEKSLEGIAGNDGVETRPTSELRPYVADQLAEIVKAVAVGADDPGAYARAVHLANTIEIAKYADGPGSAFPVYSGPDSVQAQTAWSERMEKPIPLFPPPPAGQFFDKSVSDRLVAAIIDMLVPDTRKSATPEGAPAGDPPKAPAKKTAEPDSWPSDLASDEFLTGKKELDPLLNFGNG